MPLSEDDIRRRRNMSAEDCRDQDIFRIAESLETIAETLGKIKDELFQLRNAVPQPTAFQFRK